MSDNHFMNVDRNVFRNFFQADSEQVSLYERKSVFEEIRDSLKELVRIEKDRHYREIMQEIKEYEKKHMIRIRNEG